MSLDGVHFATGKFPPTMHPETHVRFFHSFDLQFLKEGEGIHYFGIEYRFFVPPYDNVRASRPVLGQLVEI